MHLTKSKGGQNMGKIIVVAVVAVVAVAAGVVVKNRK